MKIERLVVEDKVILSGTYPSKTESSIIKSTKPHPHVYSDLLDEFLNYEVEIIFDNSHAYILSDKMYTMSDLHNIGFRNFANAKLVMSFY